MWGMYSSNTCPVLLITTYPIIPPFGHPLAAGHQPPQSLDLPNLVFGSLTVSLPTFKPAWKNSEDCIEATWLTKPIMSSFVFALYKNVFALWVRKPVGNSLKFLYQSVRVNHRGVILTLKQALLIDSILESSGVVWVWNSNTAFFFSSYTSTCTHVGRHSYTPDKILIPNV